MKYIITEEQNNYIGLRRRLFAVDELLRDRMKEIYGTKKFYSDYCDYGLDTFIRVVSEWVIERMYYDYFDDLDDSSDEWNEIYHQIDKYIQKVHYDRMRTVYEELCENN